MQYVFSDHRTYITTIEFRNTVAIPNVERMRSFREENLVGTFLKKEFRWSWDNVTWNSFQPFTQAALAGISFQDYNNFYIHIKYTRYNAISGNIGNILLTYDSKYIPPPSPDSSIIDADLLQGENGLYYLNNENHYGPSYSVKMETVADASGSDIYHGRIDTSIDTTFQLKRIQGTGSIIITDTSNAVIFGLDASVTNPIYDSALDPAISMPATVGGIPAGTTVADLDGDTMSSLWDSLLFPTIQPTLSDPTSSMSINTGTLHEVSTHIFTLQFTTPLDRGSIYNGLTFQNYRSGIVNSYNYTGAGLIDVSSALSPNQQSFQYDVAFGYQTWSCQVAYDQGPQPLDNKGGNAITGPLPAGSVGTNTITIEGAYPYFASSNIIGVLMKQVLVSMGANPAPTPAGMTLVAETGGLKQQFEIPNAKLALTSLKGIRTFNTVSSQWEYQYGTNTASLTAWSTSQVTESIQGYNVPYTRYTYIGTDRSNVLIRLEF